MIHSEPSPLANTTVTLSSGPYEGSEYNIQDYWDRIFGGSWMESDSPYAVEYTIHGLSYRVPMDDEVLYGEIDGIGHIVRVAWV